MDLRALGHVAYEPTLAAMRSFTESRGLDTPDQAQSIAICERLFAKYLGGHALLTKSGHLRGSAWLNFPRINCAQEARLVKDLCSLSLG